MRDAIREIVAEILPGKLTAPTDLLALGERLGTRITQELINGSGELRQTATGLEVVVNPQQPTVRQRFTIAHELGHVMIRQLQPAANQSTKEIERICDLFAVELLMPESIFRKHLPKEITLLDIRRLAGLHQTSLLATAHRCAELSEMTVVVAAHGKIEQVSGRMRGSTALKDEQVLNIADRACNGEGGTTQIFLTHDFSVRNWNVQFQPLGKSRRALLLLTRAALPNSE
jgi:Zn-dependent peptidase ImmA (M78 family)